ncbi:hypothetical protein B0T21DRAFT_391152 [Apiosordaria backusii]|uniref:Uncharacterized protein n=1 Tax=Apiosordaria backusii TaxID=314023 RepID=A0AA40EN77_9PEZI|nr:hypothetical protein B0T21DRAFT_391152 [Apiosordaria backusii]
MYSIVSSRGTEPDPETIAYRRAGSPTTSQTRSSGPWRRQMDRPDGCGGSGGRRERRGKNKSCRRCLKGDGTDGSNGGGRETDGSPVGKQKDVMLQWAGGMKKALMDGAMNHSFFCAGATSWPKSDRETPWSPTRRTEVVVGAAPCAPHGYAVSLADHRAVSFHWVGEARASRESALLPLIFGERFAVMIGGKARQAGTPASRLVAGAGPLDIRTELVVMTPMRRQMQQQTVDKCLLFPRNLWFGGSGRDMDKTERARDIDGAHHSRPKSQGSAPAAHREAGPCGCPGSQGQGCLCSFIRNDETSIEEAFSG